MPTTKNEQVQTDTPQKDQATCQNCENRSANEHSLNQQVKSFGIMSRERQLRSMEEGRMHLF